LENDMSDPVEIPAAPAPEPGPGSRLGPIGRARASVAAIEVLLRLREDQTAPTPEDLAALRQWPGWGPLAPALSEQREGTWAEIGEQLQRLLSPRDYRQAEQGTPTAYYTPDRIAEACWMALRDLGFRGGRILEPGCGAGTFINHAPDRMPVEWFGVERDPTTAGIAALLHPDAQIINARLQDAGLQSNSVDAVLGNVPYGNFQVHDKTAPKAVTDSIHNYFIWRSVQALRPGGVAILLTSRYTMDAADDTARRAIAKHGDLLGAVRLPNGALAEGGTGVLADILIVRRRDTDSPLDDSWMEVSEVPTVPGQYANDYFLQHPENVLGEFEQGRAARYGHTLAVKAPEGQDLAAALGEAFDGITAAARDAGRDWRVAIGAQPFTEESLPFPVREDGRKEGSFHLVDGKPHEVIDGELVAVARAGKELPKLIVLRDAALKLIEAETDHDTPDAQLDPLRAEVNRLYDAYARVHGPINRFTLAEGQVDEETGEKAVSRRYPRLGGFRRDPDVVSVLALEDFDDETQTADKAPLLLRRVNRRIERPTTAQTPEEALSLCLNFQNKIDVPTIAQLLGIEEDQVQGALGELVFPDPDNGELLTRGAYLSGPVVDKLERAEFLLSQGREDLQRHVDDLREVQPEPLAPEDIKAKLGAPWIPAEDVTAFAEEMLGVQVDILHVAKTATWSIDQPMTIPEAATSEWGTSRVNAFELLDLALNGQAPKVYDTFRTPDGGSRRVRNDKETMLAESKMSALARRFASWVWEDPDRADRLAADYNRIFNSTVLPKHDGSHLTVDGMDPEFTPYEHQWDFVQRVLSADEGSLCPYPVGAGKTATMFMTAVKLKQLGLVNKPMIVVPNHLLEQISRDGKKLFPNAEILMAGKKDLADARSRMLFAARCATGDWDAIVMTHNSFSRLGVHPVTEATYLEELANEYRVALGAIDGDDANQRRIKEIAKMVDRFDARASDLRSKATDAGVTYENLGVDFLQYDEAHMLKNLALPATTEGMSLGKPSKRATDFDLKLIVTRERTGRDNVTALYSGTFISNSVREMYVFKHYTMPKRLKKLGVGSPDAWAANFIQFESRPEVGVDGVSFRLKRRPVEYTNADEALAMFAEVAELRPREAFKIKRPKRIDRFVEIDATPNLVQYVGSISDRIDLIQQGKVKPFEDNMLNVITDGRKAALDLELVGMEPDGPGKAGAIIQNVLQIHERTKDLKLPGDPDDVSGGLQLVFCDLGTPSKDRGSQVYGKVRRGLIDGLPEEGLPGIPRERIRFIHDYNSDLAKEQLFTDARAGKVSVLFMSSEKGGTGVNVQSRGVALHHADPPHKPAEWEQREGRLDRPGNLLIDLDMEVEFLRYIALNSFDSYMFQQLERKQRPIMQIMSGRKVGRVIQEIDPVGAGFGQAKAVATGNPMLLELADVNGELTVLLNEADGHRQAQARMKRKVEVLSDTIAAAERDLPGMRAMADALAAAGDDDTWRTADGRLIDPDDIAGVLAQTAQGSKPTLDLDAGYLWRGLNVGLTFHRKQQFGSVAYESWAHLVAGQHQVDVRLNLSWFGKGQSWRIVKALDEAADKAATAPAEIEQKVAKQRTALEDTRSHIGRPFDKHAELEAVRERKAALEAQISDTAVASSNENGSGPQFDPGAAGAAGDREMTEAEMATHDAAATAGMLGGTAVVVSEGQSVGGARVIDHTGTDIRTPDLTDLGQYQEALRTLVAAAAADGVTAWPQIGANQYDPFREAFAEWAQEWALERANLPEDRPAWLRAWFQPEMDEARRLLVGDAARLVWQEGRVAAKLAGPPASEMVEAAAILRYYEPLLQRHGLSGGAAAADYITRPGYGFEPDVRNPLHDLVARIDNAAGRLAGIDRDSNRLFEVSISLTNVMTGTRTAVGGVDVEAILAAPPGTVIDLPHLPESAPVPSASGPETHQDADAPQTPPAPKPEAAPSGPTGPTPEPEESVPDPTEAPQPPESPPNESAAASTDPPATPPEQAPLQDLINGFGDRVMVGHIGGPNPARTHQSAGWAIMAVLNEGQVRGLVSAVTVDGQPVSMEPGVMPTDRVREWIAEQQQAPTAAFFASTSSELPPAMRGDGDVSLSTRADGLTIEQGDVSTTILWEELPAWIDAAVAYDAANRSASLPAWSYGSLDREIHFRRDERNQSVALALNALVHALRETAPPTDEQLAEARDRFAPPAAPATTTDPADGAENTPIEESAQQLPEDASPVPGAEGYHYTEEGRTVRLYTEAGEEAGTAKWSDRKYRYLGDVRGDIVRGTEDAATVAKRMANHHEVVYGDRVHRPTLDDQGRDPVWILHNGSDTLVFGVSPEDGTAKAAMWTGGGFKESRKVGGWYLPRTWKEPTRRQRVDDAVRVLAAAGRTVTVHTSRAERQEPPQRPARLPELVVTAPNLDEVPQFYNAEPFTDQDTLEDVQALESAYARWGQHPTVRAYLKQDNDARPDGFGTPDNPIAELHIAYHRARLALREPVPGGPDEIVRRVYGVAAWCQELEVVVDDDLLAPLQDVYAAAHGLAARSQATIAALAAEQAAAAEDVPARAPEQEQSAAAQQEPGTGDQTVPVEPAPAPSETVPMTAAEEQGPADPGPAAAEPAVAPPAPAPDASPGPAPETEGAPQTEDRELGAAGDRRIAVLNTAEVLRHYEPVLAVVGLSGADAVSYLTGVTDESVAQADLGNPFDRLLDDIGRRADRSGGISQRGREITIRDVSEDRNALHRYLVELHAGVADVRFGREPLTFDLASILASTDSRFELPDTPQWRLAAAVPAGKVVVAHDPEMGYAVFNTYRRRKAGEVLRAQKFRWDPDAVPEGVWRPRPGLSEAEQHQAARHLLDALTAVGIDHAAYGQMPDQSAAPAQEAPLTSSPADTVGVPEGKISGDEVQPEVVPGESDSAGSRDDHEEGAPSRNETAPVTVAEEQGPAAPGPAAEDAPALALEQEQSTAAQQEPATGDQTVPVQPAPAPSETAPAAAAEDRAEQGSDDPGPAAEPPAAPPALAPDADRLALTDPALRGPALEAMTAAVLDTPRAAQAARANDLDNFTSWLTNWVDDWATEEWGDVPPGDMPDWVRAYFRGGDEAAGDRNGLYAELAGPLYAQLRATEPEPAPDPAPGAAAEPPMDEATVSEQTASQTRPDGAPQAAEASADLPSDDPATGGAEAAPGTGDTASPEDESEDATASEANSATIVQTPDGPGAVIGSDDGDLVLVTTQSGTRVWETGEVQWPDSARPEDAERAAKKRQNDADAAQAATAEGIKLRYGNGNRLVDLDVDAGHGTVVDSDGAVVGWVRARIGDDGRRYWWAQDARGGPPDDMPFHEGLPPSAGVPAIRAAVCVHSELHAIKEPPHRVATHAEYAAREVSLTTAQVRELRRLTLDATYSDGSPIEPPDWVTSHRTYVLNTAQMQALGDAAQAAADAFPGVTAEERRTARVLRNAVERFEFEAYDTARWRATIPPVGEPDPYARPYQRPRAETAIDPEEMSPAPQDTPAPTPEPEPVPMPQEPASAAPAVPQAPADTQQAPGAGEQPLEPAPAPAPSEATPAAAAEEQVPQGSADPEHVAPEPPAALPEPAPENGREMHAPEEQGVQDQPTERTREGEDAASQGTGETEQLGLFDDSAQDSSQGPAELEPAMGSGAVPADELPAQDGRGAQLQAALIEGETIAPVSFTDQHAAGWILSTVGGHTFRLRPVPRRGPDEDLWEAGHDADGSYWWAANLDDQPLTAVLARIREDSATRTRFASLWVRYGHLTTQAPQFETTTDRVQLEEGVYLVRRFGRIGLIASCRWGWEHLTDPDGTQGRTGEDWSRTGPDKRQYVAEWKIWHSAQDAIPNARLRVAAQITDDMADTLDAYCDASAPYVGKCSAKRSGARYTVAVVTDQEVELGRYTVCARCLSHRLLNDEGSRIGHRNVQSLVEALAKGDPTVGALHWKQWPDRIAELAGQMLSAALDAGEAAPWPARALTDQILAEACEAGDDRAKREARAEVKAAGGNAKAQKRAAEEAVEARQDRAALIAGQSAANRAFSARTGAKLAGDETVRQLEAGERAKAEKAAGEASEWASVAIEAAEAAIAAGYEPTENTARADMETANEAARAAVAALALAGAANAEPDQPQQEEAVEEPEIIPVETPAPAVDPPGDDLPAQTLPQEEATPAVDVEDPPAARTFTETAPLATDGRYQLRLTSADSEGPQEGELLYGERTVATIRVSADGERWFARMTVDGSPADVTAVTGSPQEAAHQGAILFAVITGEPYGAPPAAADARGDLSRADVLRADLRTAAEQHLRTLNMAAARANPNHLSAPPPPFQALSKQLGILRAADADKHSSRQMAANLSAVQQAVNDWGGALPADPGSDERQHLAFPLLNLLYDTTRLQLRLQATLDAAQSARSAFRKREAENTVAADPGPRDDFPEPPPRYTRAVPFDDDSPAYQLHVSGPKGDEADSGEFTHNGATIATLHRTSARGWVARLAVDGLPADVTPIGNAPLDAADQVVVLYSALTGVPYGPQPVPVPKDWYRQQAFREMKREVRATSVRHAKALRDVVRQSYPKWKRDSRYQELMSRITAAAVAYRHGYWEMSQSLDEVRDAAHACIAGLPTDPSHVERQALLYPLATLVYDTTRLHGRLQAILDVAQAAPDLVQKLDDELSSPEADPATEAAAVTEQPAGADAPNPPRTVDLTAEEPVENPDLSQETEMAAPAGPVTPESAEGPGPDGAAEPGEDQAPADMTQREGRVERAASAEPAAAAAEEPGLPLWTGSADTPGPTEDKPIDPVADFAAVQEAWDEHVPAEQGTGADLFATVKDDIQRLKELLADAVTEAKPTAEPQAVPEAEPAPAPAATVQRAAPTVVPTPATPEPEKAEAERDPQQSADAVNAALGEVDAHGPALQDLPEWQHIQSVRGAFGHLVGVMKERAGEHIGKLMADGRVADFLRRVSIRACEKVAGWAQRGADWLRRRDQRSTERSEELPSAEALLRLGDAAHEYSGPRRGGAGTPPPPANGVADPVDIPAMRKLGEALNKPLPGAAKRVSPAAARGRSTTVKQGGAKKPAAGRSEQAGHLRRGGPEQQQARKAQR
jgi:N12 class adenine-specific DNA methylase